MTRLLGQEDQQILDLIEREIDKLGLSAGSRLPTERDLATMGGCSRNTVRRVLAVLEAEGRVSRHVGRGTFLASHPGGRPAVGQVQAASPAEIMAVRLLIEPQIMPLVVAAASPADFAEMDRCLRGGETCDSFEEFESWDEALHRSFATATHNTLIVTFGQLLTDARHQPVWGSLKRRSATPERRRDYQRDHQTIYEALLERDAHAAQQAMSLHLRRVRSNILGEDI